MASDKWAQDLKAARSAKHFPLQFISNFFTVNHQPELATFKGGLGGDMWTNVVSVVMRERKKRERESMAEDDRNKRTEDRRNKYQIAMSKYVP